MCGWKGERSDLDRFKDFPTRHDNVRPNFGKVTSLPCCDYYPGPQAGATSKFRAEKDDQRVFLFQSLGVCSPGHEKGALLYDHMSNFRLVSR